MSYEIRPVGLKVNFSEWVASWFTPVNLGCTGCGSSDYFDGIESRPDCRPLLEEFYQLVRQGQRDFSFANIWEHRQTRKVLIAGFSTLGEAIRQLETTVARSLAELKRAVEERTLIPTPAGSPARVALKFFIPIA